MNRLAWFEYADAARRMQGRALEWIGLGPRESPFQIVQTGPGYRLRRYSDGADHRPPLLIVPAPIKRPYIWDLCPQRSVVRRAIAHGLRVYLVEWMAPDAATYRCGLADYAGPMLDACIAGIGLDCGAGRTILAAHSLGGIVAALHSAYRPEQVAALVLVDAPLHFPGADGRTLTREAAGTVRVPGSYLSMSAACAAPRAFYRDRYLDHLASLGSPEHLATHWRVERWAMDELPMTPALFRDVVEQMVARDSFMRGAIAMGGRALHPRAITAPLLSVVTQDSVIAPADAVRTFHDCVGSSEKCLLTYSGDVGVALQHVGALVGERAGRDIWPRVFAWLDTLPPTSGSEHIQPAE